MRAAFSCLVLILGLSTSLSCNSITANLAVTRASAQTACNVNYAIAPQSSSAFGATLAIDNTGTTAWTSWTLSWTFANGQTISSIWNGVESQSGAVVTVASESYNGAIAAGGALTTVGFNGTWNGTANAIPTAFTINGTACSVNGASGTGSFTIAPSPSSLSVAAGGSATDTVTITDISPFAGAVTLSASGLPAGVTAAFATNPATGGSVVTFTAGSSAAATSSPVTVTVTGTSGSLTETATIALTVTAIPPISVGFSTPPPASIAFGNTASLAASVSNDPANAGVNWSCLPAGGCGSFNPAKSASAAATIYTAPTSVPSGGSVTIIATSVSNSSVSVAAAVQIAVSTIAINGKGGSGTFYGVGAISGGGGNSRLLYDYPSAQQSDILDYLFKPGVGANIQILKVEIGGGSDSTDGSESSIEPSQGTIDCDTGYEWWLMEQALARNPNIKFYALAWAAPGWLGGWWNASAADYLVSYLKCAQSHGLTINYLGGFNEDDGVGTGAWWEGLRSTLNAEGFASTQFVGGDLTGANMKDCFYVIVGALQNDPAWAAVMPYVGGHYPCAGGNVQNPSNAETCFLQTATAALGKPLWQSEGSGQDYNSGAGDAIRSIVRGYTDGNLVEFTNWPLIAALYPGLPYDTNGLIWADQPWSGWYSVGPTAWAIAQVTQFTQPGWTFIPAASGYLGGNEPNGTYMTLMSPNGADYSTVIETTTATTAQTVNFSVAGGLSTGPLQVWTTNLGSTSPTDWFKRQSSVVTPIVSSSGATYSLTLQPNFVYSITTLATGGKDAAASPIPASAEMSLPYSDSFAEYPAGAEAKYLAQIQGDFQSQPCVGQTANNCITQVVPDAPSVGFDGLVGTPWAVLGDVFWSNYTVSVDALLEQSGAVFLAGLVSAPGDTNPAGNLPEYFNGYSILVGSNGAWSLLKDSVSSAPTPLSSGSVAAPGLNAWVKLTMTFNGTNVSASIDGIQVASVTDSTYSAGQVGFGVAGWQTAQFSNLSVAPEPQSFKIASSAPNLSVAQGGSVIDSVKVTAASSFDGTVSFSVSGLPGGVTGVFSPATGATGSVLTLTAGGNAAPGTYPVIVTGTAGAQTATAGIMLTVVVDPCLIVPYIALNGVWNQMPESTVTAPLGTSVDLGPWPTTGGSWSWTGPNGFTSTSREIDNIALPSATNTYSATYTVGSCTSTQPFVITVGTGANPIIPYIAVNGVWNQTPESAVTVARGTSVNLGPWPLSGGSWSWTGPNGFTSTSREIDNIALPAATDIYTATYTVSGSSYTQAFTITVD